MPIADIRRILLVFLVFGSAPLAAQTVTDHVFPSGLPLVFEGPSFTSANAFAVCGSGRVQVVSVLPGTLSSSEFVPSGAMAMVGRWHRLTNDIAIYRSVGEDLIPQNNDDRLVLITGLPGAPVLEATSVFGRDPTSFVVVNDHTAVAVDAVTQAFEVLRFDIYGANLTRVFSSTPLSANSHYLWNRANDDAFFGLGAGLDLISGTADDQIVVLSGLDSTTQGFTIDVTPLPVGDVPGSFRITKSGVGCYWKTPAPFPQIDLVAVRLSGTVPNFASLSITSLVTVYPWYTPTCSLLDAHGDSLIVHCDQDGISAGRSLVSGFASTPVLVGEWFLDGGIGQESQCVAEGEVAFYEKAGPYSFDYVAYAAGSNPFPVHIGFSWNGTPQFLKPNSQSLVTLSDQIDPSTGTCLADSLVTTDVWGTAQSFGNSSIGQWAGGGVGSTGEYWPPRAVVLSEGRVAAFVSQAGGCLTYPTALRVFSIPVVSAWGGGGPGATTLSIDTLTPGPSNPFNFTVTDSQPMVLAWLLIGPDALAVPKVYLQTPFLAGATLHLDPQTVLAPAPIPVYGTSAILPVSMAPFYSAVAGQPFFVQALSFTTEYRFSNALMVIGG